MISTDATRLPRLMQCIGSHFMEGPNIENADDTKVRDEGNAAHWLAQQLFNERPIAPGTVCYNGVVADEEMIQHVTRYVASMGPGTEMEQVTSFQTPDIAWEVRGRCDYRTWGADSLIIGDFKYGYRAVNPMDNWTLMAHAIGSCLATGFWPGTITLRIHQPRLYHQDGPVRSWSLTGQQLIWMYHRIDARLRADASALETGPECFKCKARYNCPAFRETSMNALDTVTERFDDQLTNDEIEAQLTLLTYGESVIIERRKALQELVMHKIKEGQVFPNYGTVEQFGHRKFRKGVDPDLIKTLTGVDCSKPGLVTPAEAERRKIPESVIALLTERPSTGVKLVRMNEHDRAMRYFGGK